MKNIRVFYLKNFNFLEVKFSIYLNRRVFVMCWARQHFVLETAHEIFPTVILSLSLIQEWQLSVSVERMCTSTG